MKIREKLDNNFRDKEIMAFKAKTHHYKMLNRFGPEIDESVKNSLIFGGDERKTHPIKEIDFPTVHLQDCDSVSALFRYYENNKDKRICILNFASYKNPGGMFIEGSSAQEEALCHESTLYEVLSDKRLEHYYKWNRDNKNKALYLNRAIYSPSVIFERDDKKIAADVLTCAAPNIGTALRYKMADYEDNLDILKSRAQFMADILNEEKVDIFIAGAWGCGVFKQNPDDVCKVFYETTYGKSLDVLVHAIPSGNGNYDTFKRIVSKRGGLVL